MQTNPLNYQNPSGDWSLWNAAILNAGLMLVTFRIGGEVEWFETHTIDSENAEDVAQKLGFIFKTVSALMAQFIMMGASIEHVEPNATSVRVKFNKKDFRPSHLFTQP